MITIQNALEISTLFLTWQSNRDRNRRYFVGIVSKDKDNQVTFRYSIGSRDFEEAKSVGFVGYPAFKLSDEVYTNDVLNSFLKRLPPKSRRDFSKYLLQHNLPIDFKGSDFQLLSHTGIQLPSDGFDLVPDLSEASIPFDYVMEVAGTRHYLSFDQVSEVELGVEVELRCDNQNEFDEHAVAFYLHGQLIGYVNRLLCATVRQLMAYKCLTCRITKKSGTIDRPLLYVMLSAR